MAPHRFLLLLFLLSPAASFLSGCTLAPERARLSRESLQSLHALLEEHVAKQAIAGAVVLVAQRGEVVYLDAAGWQDVAERKPMSPETIFRICSMTKPVTSVAAMILVEEGRLALADPVSRHLPELAGMKVLAPERGDQGGSYVEIPAEREITIHHLLTHTSGLTYGFFGRERLGELYERAGVSDGLVETGGTMAENVRRLAALPLKHQPGSAWEYGLSTDVLGRVIEAASGESLADFFRRRIFEPLGMEDTCFQLEKDKRPRLATVYRPGADGAVEELPAGIVRRGAAVYSASYPLQDSSRYFSGGAGLVSTAGDYARFLQMLLNGGELDGVRLLQRSTVELMTSPQTGDLDVWIKAHGDAFGLGFGVVTETARGEGLGSPGTFSWGGFYYTYFFADPEEGLIGLFLAQLQPWGDLKLWDEFRRRVYAALRD
jgi:CubicO group peptidase (beta-lactamase class C family)